MHKRNVRIVATKGFQQVERTYGIGIKILKRNGRRPVVARLGRGMNNGIRLNGWNDV